MSRLSVLQTLLALLMLCHMSTAFLPLFDLIPDVIGNLHCVFADGDHCKPAPGYERTPFMNKLCQGEKNTVELDCREELKNVEPAGVKKEAYCARSSKRSTGSVCVLNGAEYIVKGNHDVQLDVSGTAPNSVSKTASTSTISTTTGITTTETAPPSAQSVYTNTTAPPPSSASSSSSSSSHQRDSNNSTKSDEATRTTTDLSTTTATTTTSPSTLESVLRSTTDVTVTIPPSGPASTAAATGTAVKSASAARTASLMANGFVGTLAVAFLAELCVLVWYGLD
ncbi:hypothetical protein AJ79_04456 [Helicocarpus griseus UAMH5409]|uniref:Uncharacterized protein n=1 Tax=Helicocarpus griseus UAMH5409 TaxID=1447875 RepID=A0A2B7XU48_9EURO|nr:hypothetical protein AJ79_04456 [Helicocarpus griseus UAMH5409]